jgi:flagellar protein FliO/FliZ
MPANGLTSLLWFIAVLALIPLALWLWKRSPAGARFAGSASSNAAVRSVGVLALSTSQRIVTIEVGSGEGRQWLLIGVTPTNITTLHSMPAQGDAPAAAPASIGFAQLLSGLRRDKGMPGAP